MPSLYMNGRNYTGSGSGGGGGNVYGAFIDTNRIIKASTDVPPNTDVTYTATEDCCVEFSLIANSNQGVQVSIDGVDMKVNYISSGIYTWGDIVYLRRGQTIKMRQSYTSADGSYIVYGLTFGTQNIFTPQIYSTEEREVGVWIDNKPLYQKSYSLNTTIRITQSGANITSYIDNESVIEQIVGARGNNTSTADNQGTDLWVGRSSSNLMAYSSEGSDVNVITLWYTKTTDTAGSGSYNTLGVPMVHYSTDEHVVGTDEDDNTIYEKTFKVASPTWSSGSGYATITVDISSIGTVEKLSFVRGNVYDNTDDRMFNIPYFRVENSESLLYECRVNSDGTPYFVLFVRHSSGAGYSLANLSVTLQYTKSSS